MSATTVIVHRHGVEIEPSHVVLAAILLALVLVGVLAWGIHIGRTAEDPPEHPLLDVAPLARPEHLPDRARVSARIRRIDWAWRPDPGMTRDQAAEQVPLQVAHKSRSET